MQISFMLHSDYGIGRTIRTTHNLIEPEWAKGSIAEGLLELINGDALGQRMAGARFKDPERFAPARIAECCEPIAAAPQAADFFNTVVRWEAP